MCPGSKDASHVVNPPAADCELSYKGFLARSLGDGNVLIITIFQVLTEYAAGSFLKHRSSKLRSNNQCYNTEILTQVKGHLDGSGELYLKATAQLKQEQRPGTQTALCSTKVPRARATQSILSI